MLVSTSRVYKHLGTASTVIAAVRYGGLNQADHAGLERGYYENLMGVDRFNGELWALYMNRPADWERGLAAAGPVARDGRVPAVRAEAVGGGPLQGRAAAHQPLGPARQGLPADSAGRLPAHGVARSLARDGQRRSTRGHVRGRSGSAPEPGTADGCYEILNFAVYGYNPLFQIGVLEKAAAFQPKAILYVAHPEDSDRVVRLLVQSIRDRRTAALRRADGNRAGGGRRTQRCPNAWSPSA